MKRNIKKTLVLPLILFLVLIFIFSFTPLVSAQLDSFIKSSEDFNTLSNATHNYFDEKYEMSGTDYSISYDLKDAEWLEENVPDARLVQAYARFMQPHVTESFIFLNGKTYVMPDDFNEFVSDAHLQIINEEDALGIAGVYVKAWEPSGSGGIPAAIILQSANDIPHQINPISQDIIKKVTNPVIKRVDNIFVTELYTWCKTGGWVREWHISIGPQGIVTAENKVIGEYVGDCIVRGAVKDRISKSYGEYLITQEMQPLSIHTRDVIIDGQTRFVIHWRDEDFTAASDSDANTVVNWVESAARTSWTTEIDNWDFDEPPDQIIDIYIWNNSIPDGAWGPARDAIIKQNVHGPFHWYKGLIFHEQYIYMTNDLVAWLAGKRIYYPPTKEDIYTNVFSHEFLHAIQKGYKVLDTTDWIIEGTARFEQTAIMPDAEFWWNSNLEELPGGPYNQDTNHQSMYIYDSLRYIVDPDETLYSKEYSACIYWKYIYEHQGGIDAIKDVFEQIKKDKPGSDFDKQISSINTALGTTDMYFVDFSRANFLEFSPNPFARDDDYYEHSECYYVDVNRDPVNLVGTTQTQTFTDDFGKYSSKYFEIDAVEPSEIFVSLDGKGKEFFMNEFINSDENNELGPLTNVLSASWVFHENKAKDTVLIIGRAGKSGDLISKFALIIPNIIKPTQTAPVNVGPHDNPNEISIEVETKTSEGKFIPGLTKKEYYTVKIGDKTATINNIVEKPDRYELEIMPPTQTADGLYDLNVTLGSLSDLEKEAINYGAKGVDVALIIDSSGSMSWNDPGGYRKTAAEYFVDKANTGDKICVADFGHSWCYSRLLLQLLEITDESSRNTVKSAINQVVDGGSTPIGYGLQRGYNELSSSRAVASHNKAGILLTDGYDTCYTEGTARTYAQYFGNNGWFLYTIGLTGDADENLLQELARLGNGEYKKAPTNKELLEIYNAISGRVTGKTTISTSSGTVQQGTTNVETALIDSSVTSATFSVSWSGSDLNLELQKPDGSIIDPNVAAADPNIDYTSAQTYEFYTVNSPMPGQWKLRIYGASVPYGGEPYTASVMGTTDLTMNLYFDRSQYSEGEPIKVSVSLSDATQPITGANVVADVELPSTTTSTVQALAGKDILTEEEQAELARLRSTSLSMTSSSTSDQITLFDDGMHGDGMADDGVYANFYTDTDIEGTYKFSVEASGTWNSESFTREAEQSTYVYGTSTGEISVTPTAWDIEFDYGISVEKNFTVESTVDTIAIISATDLTDAFGNVISAANIILSPSTLSLTANEPQNFTANLTIPPSSPAGNYNGSIIITAPEGTVDVEITITSHLVADLTLSSADISFSPATPTEGDSVTITATVHNIGDADANNFMVSFFDDTVLIGTDTISVSAGSSTPASVSWTATAGDHNIRVIADSGDAIEESDETNNEASKTLPVRKVNRTVSLTANPATVTAGAVSEITATVTEEGSSAPAGISIHFETDFGIFTESRSNTYTAETNERGIAVANFTANEEGTANIAATEPNGASDTAVVTVNETARIPGDVNGDTKINIQDAILLFNYVSFPSEQGTTYVLAKPENANVNGDTGINIQDAILLFNYVSFPSERGTTYILQ